MTQFAEVAVYSGRPLRTTFTYAIPDKLGARVGHAVFVPFGRQTVQGVVLAVMATTAVADPRPILSLIEEHPVLSSEQTELARWIADYYQAPLFDCVALFLGPGFERKPVRMLQPAPLSDASILEELSPRERSVLDAITRRRRIEARKLDEVVDGKAAPTVRALIRGGLVEEQFALAEPSIRRQQRESVRLAVGADAARAAINAWPQSRRSRQADLVERLLDGPVAEVEARRIAGARQSLERWVERGALVERAESPVADGEPEACLRLAVDSESARAAIATLRRTGAERREVAVLRTLLDGPRAPADLHSLADASRRDVDALIAEALVERAVELVDRDPLAGRTIPRIDAPALTADQQAAYGTIGNAINRSNAARREQRAEPGLFLLRGVTGSGKTEVYLAAVDHARGLGLGAIVLVPEIALTPQTVDRFRQRFDKVAVWHSGLTAGERLDTWRRIREGDVDVVVGSRSALFAPVANLGLIVVDEEHEWTYKQTEPPPRYHVREVAEAYARRTGAVVVFGSATPDLVTAARTQSGQYTELRMPQRVMRIDPSDPTSHLQSAPLPMVDVVDMRAELREGNRSIFSRELASAIDEALSNDDQIMLFLNRRGAASLVCRNCGETLSCDRCSVPFTYHAPIDSLRCHECGRTARPTRRCPHCEQATLRPMGLGTQKLEDEVAARFPLARPLRYDSDTTRAKNGHERILNRFRSGEANVLVGTQMIAKGHDIPAVTLVGVVNADTALRLPDYTGPERTFQLLTQVAGRAGRGPRGGRVVIQTYSPDHYALTAAAGHNYESFFAEEMAARSQHDYPPYGRLARLVYGDRDRDRARDVAQHMAASLIEDRDRRGLPGPEVLGPTPSYIYRRRNLYRFQLTLRGADPLPLLRPIDFPRGWTVDVDPVSLL
jgi:primosomal protein N' (replication factor Y)